MNLLGDLGEIPEDICNDIAAEENADVLRRWLKCAARAENFEDYRNRIGLELTGKKHFDRREERSGYDVREGNIHRRCSFGAGFDRDCGAAGAAEGQQQTSLWYGLDGGT